MSFSLTWLPDVLINAGLKVALEKNWDTRGRGDVREIFGVICHHTGVNDPQKQNMPTLRALRDGRKAEPHLAALPGPLAQLGLGRDGTYYIIAAGRAIHAGQGSFKGASTAIAISSVSRRRTPVTRRSIRGRRFNWMLIIEALPQF